MFGRTRVVLSTVGAVLTATVLYVAVPVVLILITRVASSTPADGPHGGVGSRPG